MPNLHQLPSEVLMTITDNLDLIDRLSLSLVSKSTHAGIAPKHLWNMRETKRLETYFRDRQVARQLQAAEDAKALASKQTTTRAGRAIGTTATKEAPIPNTRKTWLLRLQKDLPGFVYCSECDVIHSLCSEKEKTRKCFVGNGLTYGGDMGRKGIEKVDRKRKRERGTGEWMGRLRKR